MIELTGVRQIHRRGGGALLDGIDLTIAPGTAAVVTASAGAGLTTLLGLALGDLAPDDGTVALFDRDLARLRRSSLAAARRRIGIVPQDLRLLLDRSAGANVALALEIDAVPRAEVAARVAEILGRVGLALELDVRVGDLSMAQRQRVAIARALVRDPAVIVLDQPTAHDDADGAGLLATLLAERLADGAACLIATRDPALIAATARRGWRQLALRGGRLTPIGLDAVLAVLEPEIGVEIDLDFGGSGSGAVVRPITEINTADILDAIPNVVPFPITARVQGHR